MTEERYASKPSLAERIRDVADSLDWEAGKYELQDRALDLRAIASELEEHASTLRRSGFKREISVADSLARRKG